MDPILIYMNKKEGCGLLKAEIGSLQPQQGSYAVSPDGR